MARAVPESPAAGRVLALAGGVDRVIAAVCQVIILVTTIVLLGVLGANVVARYAFGGGGLHWVSEVPEQLFPWRRFAHAVIAAGVATGVVMLVIMASAVVGWIMTFVQAPQLFATWAIETLQTPWLIILAMIGIMMVAGMFIDLPAAILLLGPIFVPLANQIGLDLLQLGILMVLTLALGLYTPPVGTTLFISSSIARVSIIQTTRELWPFYLAALTVVALFAYIPALTLH